MAHWFAAERGWTPDTVDDLDYHWARRHIEWSAKRTKGTNKAAS